MKLSTNQWHCKQEMTEEINKNKNQYFKNKIKFTSLYLDNQEKWRENSKYKIIIDPKNIKRLINQ